MLKDLYHGFLDLLYPPDLSANHLKTMTFPTEPVCLKPGGIALNHPPFCLKCSRQLKDIQKNLCANCRRFPPEFDFAWCASPYTDPLKKYIHEFKYYQKTMHRHFFGRLMVHFVRRFDLDIEQFDMIVAIPLHPARLRERGYNQSALLAGQLAKTFSIPHKEGLLRKTRPTRNQVDLLRKERFTNILGAFTIKSQSDIGGKNILLIDDILTTGATASEAARALKENGAEVVGVFTLSAG